MKKVTVSAASGQYEVITGTGLDYGQLAAQVHRPCRAVIVSDDNVYPLYGDSTEKSFVSAGFDVRSYVIPNGEKHKTPQTVVDLLEYLSAHHVTRKDILIALGGGVVGDITGFAAAVYQRGIDFIQLPTTLLAAIDASVGGKTGVDLMAGKNMMGAFHQPIGVFCDTEAFTTLPKEVFSDGLAEAIKYAVISDRSLFDKLMSGDYSIAELCCTCVAIKSGVVQRDEFEAGERMILNFGHTVGHAVEALSDYKLSHGSSVAVGMMIVTRAAEAVGLTDKPFSQQLEQVLQKYGLPTVCSFAPTELAKKIGSDKKRAGDKVTFVIPKEIGRVDLYPLAIDEIEGFIEKGC